jgi:hypothetical protein
MENKKLRNYKEVSNIIRSYVEKPDLVLKEALKE